MPKFSTVIKKVSQYNIRKNSEKETKSSFQIQNDIDQNNEDWFQEDEVVEKDYCNNVDFKGHILPKLKCKYEGFAEFEEDILNDSIRQDRLHQKTNERSFKIQEVFCLISDDNRNIFFAMGKGM